jgi:pimeloyl-ACP methyl ester carboxylesterase
MPGCGRDLITIFRLVLERMDHFHFGPDSLFGSITPSPPGGAPSAAVVLCYPFGQEYTRAHRAYRQLATLVSRMGSPVLRFDYFGTGDSPGEGVAVTLERWVEDVGAAMDEVRERSGLDRVRVAGLRLGGVAAALAAERRNDVEQVVLWDPVIRGQAFLDEVGSDNLAPEDPTWWVNGFPLSESFRREVEDVDLCRLDVPAATRVVQVISHRNDEFERFSEAMEARSVRVETRLIPSSSNWNYSDDVGGILLPRNMVRGIVNALVG